jgi:hypothetical protein
MACCKQASGLGVQAHVPRGSDNCRCESAWCQASGGMNAYLKSIYLCAFAQPSTDTLFLKPPLGWGSRAKPESMQLSRCAQQDDPAQ